MLPAEFTAEQYAEARQRVRTYNRSIARAIQTDDEKALVSTIQELENYQDTYGRTERRLAAYELDRAGTPARRIGYLPKDAPRRIGEYLATLHRPEGKRRLEGNLSLLRPQPAPRGYVNDRRG
jgi:hypothetical protein